MDNHARHKEFVSSYFRRSAENFYSLCSDDIMVHFVDSKQPQNPPKFEPFEIYHPYGSNVAIFSRIRSLQC